MSDSSQITVRGRVGTEPEVLVTANGREMTRFRLGSTRRYQDASGEWREEESQWFTVKAWGSLSEPVCRSIHRGMPVVVQGRLSTEEWVSGERTGHTTVITASLVAVDIKYGLVTHTKLLRETPPGADSGPETDEEVEQDEAAVAARAAEEAGPGLDEPWVKASITT